MNLLAFISTLNWSSYAHPWSMLRRMRKDTYEFTDPAELGRVTKKRSMIIERDVKLQDKDRAIKYKCIKANEVEPKAKRRRCRPPHSTLLPQSQTYPLHLYRQLLDVGEGSGRPVGGIVAVSADSIGQTNDEDVAEIVQRPAIFGLAEDGEGVDLFQMTFEDRYP
jgi:hypothetical protein